ncbi:MAG: signal peptidase II [Mariniblastus sp.]
MSNVQVSSNHLPNTNSEATSLNSNQGGRLPLNRLALFFLPCLIGLAIDLWTKAHMFANYFDPVRADRNSPMHARQTCHWWIEGVFGIETSTNPGALFGMGSGYSSVFAVFSVVALVGILVWLFVYRAAFDRWLTFALGMISGGILGNLYDRVGLGHLPTYPDEIKNNVRDWILFRLDGVPFFDPWPNFNIADALLVAGAIMLFIHAILYAEPSKPENESPSNDIDGSENEVLSVTD